MNIIELQLRGHLKQHGYSLTAPRKAVFAALLEPAEAITMAQLVEACEGQLDRATVYRTVELFERLGVMQRVPIGWKYKLELTDTFSAHHHHLTCRECGTITALGEDNQLESRLSELAWQYDFLPDSHQLEIRGLCQNCQKNMDPARNFGRVGRKPHTS